jgi:hypothetical protein
MTDMTQIVAYSQLRHGFVKDNNLMAAVKGPETMAI